MSLDYVGINQWKDHTFDSLKNSILINNHDKIILFGQCEYEYYYFSKLNDLLNLCKIKNKPLHIITGGAGWNTSWENVKLKSLAKENIVLHEWGTYWFTKAFGELCRFNTRKINDEDNLNYDYHFISMNNRLHMHRCMFIDLLAKNDLIKHGAVSVHLNEIKKLGENKFWINKYPWEYFKPTESLVLDEQYIDGRNQAMLPNQYYKSFMQVVSETAANGIFLTEKTATPLIMGKPFLIVSERGFYKFLTDLGFQLYDEIFDYSFDSIENRENRYDMVLENVVKISKLPKEQLPELYQLIKPKIEYNKALVKKIILDKNTRPAIVNEMFDHYEQTGHEIDPELLATYRDLRTHKEYTF